MKEQPLSVGDIVRFSVDEDKIGSRLLDEYGNGPMVVLFEYNSGHFVQVKCLGWNPSRPLHRLEKDGFDFAFGCWRFTKDEFLTAVYREGNAKAATISE